MIDDYYTAMTMFMLIWIMKLIFQFMMPYFKIVEQSIFKCLLLLWKVCYAIATAVPQCHSCYITILSLLWWVCYAMTTPCINATVTKLQ